MSFSFLTAGESHGKALVGIVDGIPSGLRITSEMIHSELLRRKLGFGRGARQKIENDQVEILSGIRFGESLGSPISLLIANKDWESWRRVMAVEPSAHGTPLSELRQRDRPITIPRPGHADYVGGIKYGHPDLRSVLERASARETAMRVAVGTIARLFLAELGIWIGSHVVAIGSVQTSLTDDVFAEGWLQTVDASPVRCLCPQTTEKMIAAIEAARRGGDTLGGVFEVRAVGLPMGLGSYSQWNRRLDGKLGQAFLSLNAIKGVEIGFGFEGAARLGSQVHDVYEWADSGELGRRSVRYASNRSGGIDGGMSTGEPLVVRAAMKPLATLMTPLQSVDLKAGTSALAHIERSDVCAVPSAAVIGESLVALVLAEAILEKFGGDRLAEVQARFAAEGV